MTQFNNFVANQEYDGLIASANPPAEVFSVPVAHGAAEKTVTRGTVLENADEKAYAILADDVLVSASADAIAIAYRTGHFVRGRVKNEDGSAVTAEQEDSLRLYGILLSDAVEV